MRSVERLRLLMLILPISRGRSQLQAGLVAYRSRLDLFRHRRLRLQASTRCRPVFTIRRPPRRCRCSRRRRPSWALRYVPCPSPSPECPTQGASRRTRRILSSARPWSLVTPLSVDSGSSEERSAPSIFRQPVCQAAMPSLRPRMQTPSSMSGQ